MDKLYKDSQESSSVGDIRLDCHRPSDKQTSSSGYTLTCTFVFDDVFDSRYLHALRTHMKILHKALQGMIARIVD